MLNHRIILSFVLSLGLCFSAISQIQFEDISSLAGVDSTGTARGISVVDYDNDGDQDLYFSFSTGTANILFRNDGDLTFTNVSEESGLDIEGFGNCSTWADYDNDGFTDVYIGFLGDPNQLFHNNGDGTFENVTLAMGVEDDLNTRSVLWADFNNDGWLDLYVHNINAENKHFISQAGTGFINAVETVGTVDTQVAQGAVAFDYDNDGDLDLYLVHDANQNNLLYQNDGAGYFTNVAAAEGLDFAANGMGVDFADINNNGFFDVYVTNLGINGLFVYDTVEQEYTFATFESGAEGNGMSWGTLFFDANNDGLEDIYVANDSFFSPLPNFFYQNNGDLTFSPILEAHPMCGFNASWGAATGDLDNDGKTDLIVATANAIGQQVFHNTTENGGNWIGFDLEGVQSNTSAIGARVTVFTENMQRMDEVTSASGFAAQNSLWLNIGIGDQEQVDSVQVRWPSGSIETSILPTINTYHHWTEGGVYQAVDPFVTLVDGQIGQGADDGIKDDSEAVGVAEHLQNALSLAPNPATSVCVLQGCRTGDRCVLRASNGVPVHRFEALGSAVRLDLDHMPAGLYILEVRRGSALARKRLVLL